MSIFSPGSSDMTLRTRCPIGPMQEPLALTPGAVERTAKTLADRDDQALDALPVLVALARHSLAHWQQGLKLAQVDHHIVRIAPLLDDARDQVTLLAGELAVPDVVLGV